MSKFVATVLKTHTERMVRRMCKEYNAWVFPTTLPPLNFKKATTGLCLVVFYAMIWSLLAWYGVEISHEHGPMENAQAWCLLLGCLLYVSSSQHSKGVGLRILLGSLALFYASCFLREVEVEDLHIPAILIFLGSGVGKKYLLVSCWLIALGFFLRFTKPTWTAFTGWLKTAGGICMVLGGIFYLLGMPFDKKAFGISYDLNILLEELLESVATLLMLVSAFMSFLRVSELKKTPAQQAIQ